MKRGTLVEVHKVQFDGREVREVWLPAIVLYKDRPYRSTVVLYPDGMLEAVLPSKLRKVPGGVVNTQHDERAPDQPT